MSDPIKDYARAVAVAVRDECREVADEAREVIDAIDLDAILASVPAPEAQHHDAPTCGIDPEEVRQEIEFCDERGINTPVVAAAREYLRLREQPAPDDEETGMCEECPHFASDHTAMGCPDCECKRTPAPDVQAQEEPTVVSSAQQKAMAHTLSQSVDALPDVQARFQTVELDDVAHRALRQAAQDVLDEAPTIQAQIDAAYLRGAKDQAEALSRADIDAAVADCEQRCATQLADYISRSADDERQRIDAAVAREREAVLNLIEAKRVRFNVGTRTSLALGDLMDQIRARSGAKGTGG